MTRQQWGGVLAAIVVAWNAWQGGTLPIPGPSGDDVLRQCSEADRAAKAALVAELASMDFPGDTPEERAIPASDWWLEQAEAKRIEAFTPFTDKLAEAMHGGTLKQFAESIK